MIKLNKLVPFLLALPLVSSCAASHFDIQSEQEERSKTLSAQNATCSLKVYCEHSKVSLNTSDWLRTMDITPTVGESVSLSFKADAGYELPTGVYSIENESGPIEDYTYTTGDKFATLSFTIESDTTIKFIDNEPCVQFLTSISSDNFKIGFTYSGGLKYVDWGDGTIQKEFGVNDVIHTYPRASANKVMIKVVGNVRSVRFARPDANGLIAQGNYSITKIYFGKEITSIPAYAFADMYNLQEINISSSITNIGDRAFSPLGVHTASEVKINISGDNPRYKNFGDNGIVDKNTNTLIFASKSFTPDETITGIGNYACENRHSVEMVSVPTTITSIGKYAFNGCYNLSVFDMNSFTPENTPPALGDSAFNGCNKLSIKIKDKATADKFKQTAGWSDVTEKFSVPLPYLTITAHEALTLSIKGTFTDGYPLNQITLKYSLDKGETWPDDKVVTIDGAGKHKITDLSANQTISFKAVGGTNPSFGNINTGTITKSSYYAFNCDDGVEGTNNSKQYSVSGNLVSLIDDPDDGTPENVMDGKCFPYLFKSDGSKASTTSQLISAVDLALPDTVSDYCYAYMFTSLPHDTQSLPLSLPAMTLKPYCYYGMFAGSTGLACRLPELPATTLDDYCYASMFMNCREVEDFMDTLPATKLEPHCYEKMFIGCSSMIKPPSLPATQLAEDCYNQMFSRCTDLNSFPVLTATTLPNNCYYRMFYGVNDLNITNSYQDGAVQFASFDSSFTQEQLNAAASDMIRSDFGINGTPIPGETYYYIPA